MKATRDAEFTVIDVIRDLGFEPENEFDWAVGQKAQKVYAWRYGRQPRKDLRPKTHRRGVHCFALYPEDFRPTVEKIVRKMAADFEAARSAQPALPGIGG